MDKTININLGGSLFQIDEEAFVILRNYLQEINTRLGNLPGGPETVEDIEFRIAEIFQSQKGTAGIISRQNVEAMISIVGKPEEFDLSDGEEQPLRNDYTEPKRLYRNPDDSVVSGVCGGLGAYFNMDPVLFRVLFVLFAIAGGTGILIYLILWIAVPSADSLPRKKEMYGKNFSHSFHTGQNTPTRSTASSGINEIFHAIGKVFFVIFRIFMIAFGVIFVIMGFLMLVAFIMVFVFKLPDTFSHDGFSFNLGYLPEMMKYIASPAAAPWITALSFIVILLPLIAIIYWGVRMIFWFRARDRWINISALLLWVIAATALSILLFNEGISFAEHASTISMNVIPDKPDTLHVVTRNRIDNLKYDQEFAIPDAGYSMFLVDSAKRIFVKPQIRLRTSEDNNDKVEVKKWSAGRTRNEARKKSESLRFNYSISNDTVYLDEYFIIPAGRKWSADFVTLSLYLPENSVLFFDDASSRMVSGHIPVKRLNEEEYDYRSYHNEESFPGSKYWIYSEDGLRETTRRPPRK